MMMMTESRDVPRELRPFLDAEGCLTQWPSRLKVKRMAIEVLATKFEPGRDYTEKEVNELLNRWHTFNDWAVLRRLLCDWGYVDRERDGSRYRLRPGAAGRH
jgi:hypothetical protein